MVPILSIVFMGVVFVFVIALAIVMPVVIKKKWQTDVYPYFMGFIVFAVFALILESIMHVIVLGATGDAITGNIWLYALYGGFAAGIFEETGRFIAMKFFLKKYRSNNYNALMYGAGHGCFEAVAIVGITMINNIIYSLMINAGQIDAILSKVPVEQQEAVNTMISQLTDTSSYIFLLSGFERITAIMLHISFSVLVWIAVTNKKTIFYPLAVFLHAFVDGLLVILQSRGLDQVLLEIILFILSCMIAYFAYFLWKKYLMTGKEIVSESEETE